MFIDVIPGTSLTLPICLQNPSVQMFVNLPHVFISLRTLLALRREYQTCASLNLQSKGMIHFAKGCSSSPKVSFEKSASLVPPKTPKSHRSHKQTLAQSKVLGRHTHPI